MYKRKFKWLMWLVHIVIFTIGVMYYSRFAALGYASLGVAIYFMVLLLLGRLELLGNVKLYHWELLIIAYCLSGQLGRHLWALNRGVTLDSEDNMVNAIVTLIYLFFAHIFALGVLFGDGIHLAAALNLTPVMKRLLDDGGYRLNMRASNENTALIVAAKYNRMKAVRLLLDHGADRTLRNIRGKTAADYALENGNDEMYKLLIANEPN